MVRSKIVRWCREQDILNTKQKLVNTKDSCIEMIVKSYSVLYGVPYILKSLIKNRANESHIHN
jgi:hypothetical protein